MERAAPVGHDHPERQRIDAACQLTARALDATVLAYPEIGEAVRLGMNVLAHMRDMKTAAFPMNVIAVRRPFLRKTATSSSAFSRPTPRRRT
jgi:hypothetical protein